MSDKVECICIFSSLYYPSMGGVEVYTSHLAQKLSRLGYRIIVVTCNTHDAPVREEFNGVEVLRLPCRLFLNGRFPIPLKLDESKEWNWLLDQPVDYVIVQTRFYLLSHRGLEFARNKAIVPILIEHGSAYLTLGNPLLDIPVRALEHVLTVRTRRYQPDYYGVSHKASEWLAHFGIVSQGELHAAIDVNEFVASASDRDFRTELHLSEDVLLVCFVGRMIPEKGVYALAEASKSLPDSVVLVLAGDGSAFDSLKSYEGPSFRLLGGLDRCDVARLLIQADLMCLPSRSEGFGMVLLEAAACKTSILTTAVGVTDELIVSKEYGALLVDTKPETITNALRSAACDRARLVYQGERLNELVKSEFSWETTAAKALEACRKAQTKVS